LCRLVPIITDRSRKPAEVLDAFSGRFGANINTETDADNQMDHIDMAIEARQKAYASENVRLIRVDEDEMSKRGLDPIRDEPRMYCTRSGRGEMRQKG
jgi:hypothetical protein